MSRLTATAYGLSSMAGEGPSWKQQALCKDNPDLWVDIPGSDVGNAQAAKAAHVCLAHCSAVAQCRADVLAIGAKLGAGLVQAAYRVKGKAQVLGPVAPSGHGRHCPPGSWQPKNERRILVGVNHGRLAAYRSGCQCGPCTEAAGVARRKQKAKAAA